MALSLEFKNVGRMALIRQALYGRKVAGRDFWLHLRKCMTEIGFESSKEDTEVWFRASNHNNEYGYYEYVLLYVDDCLVISDLVESLLKDELGQHFVLKKISIGPPLQYLA